MQIQVLHINVENFYARRTKGEFTVIFNHKRIVCAAMCTALVLLSACGKPMPKPGEAQYSIEVPDAEELTPAPAETAEYKSEEYDFSELSGLEFYFASGAGGWNTVMHIHDDGSFDGYYHDSEMGSTGDGYPKGCLYECSFSGRLENYTPVNANSFSFTAAGLEYEQPGREIIDDGIKFITAEPYGLSEGCTLMFYRAGTALSELGEEARMWLGRYGDVSENERLNMIAACNTEEGYAFSSYPMYAEETPVQTSGIYAELEALEKQAAEIENRLKNADLSQTEMNSLSGELYKLWDDELNSMWTRLKDILDAESMQQLTREELEWIDFKDRQTAQEAADYEGGSMYPLVSNTAAAQLTKDRVYELARLF